MGLLLKAVSCGRESLMACFVTEENWRDLKSRLAFHFGNLLRVSAAVMRVPRRTYLSPLQKRSSSPFRPLPHAAPRLPLWALSTEWEKKKGPHKRRDISMRRACCLRQLAVVKSR
ncbi:hypothetical protein CDAR_2381 [Caerostris darwini]|uniref:Uncharacterized protein n=1 Tax=Caerostris darwini TaxID=1538125 RepID=A0AAV4W8D9_9ARAC|nr:hypothetical protein CDAR_2381 [Caerostris darwini]